MPNPLTEAAERLERELAERAARNRLLVCPSCGASGGDGGTCTVCGSAKVEPSRHE